MSVLTRLPIELAEMSVFVSMYVSIFIYKSPRAPSHDSVSEFTRVLRMFVF